MMYFHETSLSQALKRELSSQALKKKFHQGEVVFFKEDQSDQVYFINSGSAKALTFDAEGKSVFFMDYIEGDIFGYYAAFTKKSRTATIICKSEMEVSVIESKKFLDFIALKPEYTQIMMTYMANHLRQSSLRLSRNSTMPSENRVAAFLAYLLEENNEKIIHINSREDMASQLDMTRETLSRILNKFTKDNLITLTSHQIEVLNQKGLYKIFSEED